MADTLESGLPLLRKHSHSFNLEHVAHDPEIDVLPPQPLIRKESVHNIGEQAKEREVIYVPKEWVHTKIDQIKTKGTLMTEAHLIAETIKISENIITIDLLIGHDRTSVLEFRFYQDGIIKLYSRNPSRPAKVLFEMVEQPANLVPYIITEATKMLDKSFIVIMKEVQAKLVVDFEPFEIKLISTIDNKEITLLEMNTNKSLLFDDNVAGDFTFHNEFLYGLAEHATDLLLEDTKDFLPYRFYNQDVPKYVLGSKNGIYGTIPLIISRNKESPTFVSLYWQNMSDTYIEMHKAKSSTKTFLLSERGDLDCYIFVSHSSQQHFKSLAHLFGHSAMPQYFSLGYHQSRWSYLNEIDVLGINEKFNEYEIPCDSITLDIDHTQDCRYFTWNKESFPDPERMQDLLDKDDRQLITIADPHIKVDEDYRVYSDAIRRGLFVKTQDDQVFIGKCWPGDSVYLDFLNEDTRKYWASQYSFENYKYSKPNVWAWNDMNEPSVFEQPSNAMPLENLQLFKLSSQPDKQVQVEHREVHNIYGFCQHKATYDGMLNRNADKNIRPHILSRSFYAGSQKYTTIWTGDTGATWDYLRMTVPQLLSLSLCGFSNSGGDVGGFIGTPEPELAVRWYQLGAFMPYFRGHSETTGPRREPWLYDSLYFNAIKEAIKERYRLLPYWYTSFEEHCRTALPLLRPIWFDQNIVNEAETMSEQVRFMVGQALLVVPILEPNQGILSDFLRGMNGRWYDYFTNKEVFNNEKIIVGIEKIGCFVKGGHIIPKFELDEYKKSTTTIKECDIFLYIALDENNKSKGEIYFDDGQSFNYKKGGYCRVKIDYDEDGLDWKVDQGTESYKLNNKVTKMIITGANKKFKNAFLLDSENNKSNVKIVYNENYIEFQLTAEASKNWKILIE